MGFPPLPSMGNGSFCIQVLPLKVPTCTFPHLCCRGLLGLTHACILVIQFYSAGEETLASTLSVHVSLLAAGGLD